MRKTPDVDSQTGARVFALSVHADFACRHSGACCTAGWHIPVEPEIRRILKVEVLAPQADGSCGWYDRGARRCSVHRDHGPALLPSSCHHFPRRALTDDRGTFVTLSHFCPTAANQLFRTDRRLEIVEAPDGFPASRDYDGLDGRDTWPPLLRPDLLFDHDSFDRWERFVVGAFAVEDRPASVALRQIASAAEQLRTWTVEAGPLRQWTERCLTDETGQLAEDQPTAASVLPGVYRQFGEVGAFSRVAGSVPVGLDAPAAPADVEGLLERYVMPAWDDWQSPLRRYLAAKAFGSW